MPAVRRGAAGNSAACVLSIDTRGREIAKRKRYVDKKEIEHECGGGWSWVDIPETAGKAVGWISILENLLCLSTITRVHLGGFNFETSKFE